jgi:two-component system, LytTR family, response regulator
MRVEHGEMADLSGIQAGARSGVRDVAAHTLWILACVVAFVAYFVVKSMTSQWDFALGLKSALVNVLALLATGTLARAVILRFLANISLHAKLFGNLAAGVCFTCLLYWLITIVYGIVAGTSLLKFSVDRHFVSGASAWQLMQGLVIYGLIAALTYMEIYGRQINSARGHQSASGDSVVKNTYLSRYFIRDGENYRPVNTQDIVSISGAGDYSEISVLSGKHLTQLTLAQFEASLPPDQFIRVHRSRIVNLNRIERAESAGGGRMLIYLQTGELVQTSRSGAKQFKERVI